MTTATELIRELQADPALAAQVRGAILGEELLTLPAVVGRLAEAQARTEASLATLTERVDRLAERVDRLAEAQARTEASLATLTERVDRLAEAQARTEASLAALTERVDRLAAEVGDLRDELRREMGLMSQAFGATAEDEATDGLLDALEAGGYVVHGEPVANLGIDGQELDVVVSATGPDGVRVSAVVEAKARLGAGEVRRFAAKMDGAALRDQLAGAGFPGPWLAFVYGIRVDGRARQAAQDSGLGVLAHAGGPAVVQPRLIAG